MAVRNQGSSSVEFKRRVIQEASERGKPSGLVLLQNLRFPELVDDWFWLEAGQ